MKRKNISTLIALLLTISYINVTTSMADKQDYISNEIITCDLKAASSEKCGDNLTWEIQTIDSESVLKISGKGEMYNFDYSKGPLPPWNKKRDNITKIIIEKGVTSIGTFAFSGCNVESISIPDSVTNIGESAFSSCYKLKSMDIPDSVLDIGKQAFYYSGLSSITLSNKITNISDNMFFQCTKLTSIKIPNSVTTISNEAFNYCSNLSSVSIPDSVTSIGNGAFGNCSSLTSVKIPDSVQSIGDYTFTNCTNLNSIVIPSSTNIGDGVFYKTPWLENEQKKNPLVIINETLVDGKTCIGDIVIPDSVKRIARESFSGGSSITSVTIPNSISKIDSWTFAYCSNLVSITIPDSVTSISGDAFYYCSKLKLIKGYKNTAAEEFAKNHKIQFELLNNITTSTTAIINNSVKYGDSNCDNSVDLSDAVLVMQSICNPSKYGIEGTDKNHITAQGQINGDVAGNGDGITNSDALTIQKYCLGQIKELPEK